MIRFSAALVAVAIGVLIGGIATSKLLLVYIAIVVSAVALLALAIGVVVKREELFGEGQGLVPAGAGAAPVLPARTGESLDQNRVAAGQQSPVASVPPSAPFPGPAAGHGSLFDGTVQAAPPVTAAPPPAAANPAGPHQARDGQERDRVADPAPPWEAQPARDQWSSPPLPGSTTAAPAPDWMPGSRGTSDPVGQAEATAPFPSSKTSPEPSASSGPSSAGPDSASPNWFAPRARSVGAASSATEAPADPPAADEARPARYSWLDDEADQSDVRTAGRAVPVAAGPGPEPGPGPGEPEPADAEPVSANPEPESAGPEPETAELGTVSAEPPAEPAEPGTGPAEPQAGPAASEPPSADDQDPEPGVGLVAVLPGVPRYHQPECVLIRFLPEGEVQRLPAAQAKADGCTPCAACQPAE